ncbi:MAG: iron-containing redox enzyme family protein [Thermoleophilaceae bacterium]|nr:iron-containing redox enzyme family protein [Thermoleophilaceae bacterium]
MPPLPSPRGEISALLLEKLPGPVQSLDPPSLPDFGDPLSDEDLQLSLYLLYELHYRGFDGVDDAWEWEPSLVALAGRLEQVFEAAVREAVGALPPAPAPEEADRALRAAAEADDGPSMSLYLSRDGTDEQMLEFMTHRSAYQLKESDPHSWAVPRLTGRPKAALVEIQADEYGAGRPERIHAEMYARSMQAVGLDPSYGAYLDRIPGVTLAPVNLMSFFGLHRRLRGATVGHLALFEITSAVPSRRYADALRRLGYEGEAPAFFDEHAEADAVHENIAAVDLAGGLIRQDPGLADDVMFGALALIELDARWARHVLESWNEGRSSLAPGTPEPAAV